MAVLELVASEIDPNYGVSLNQYACGWTILRPFGSQSIKVSLALTHRSTIEP
jgi:hypothetical protein